MSTQQKYRMDKTAFKIQSVEEANDAMQDYSKYTLKEKLEIAFYLTSIAYCFDMKYPPRMDKSVFRIKKLQN